MLQAKRQNDGTTLWKYGDVVFATHNWGAFEQLAAVSKRHNNGEKQP